MHIKNAIAQTLTIRTNSTKKKREKKHGLINSKIWLYKEKKFKIAIRIHTIVPVF